MSNVKFITPPTAMTVLRLLRALFAFVSAVATALVTMWSGYVYAGVLTINFPVLDGGDIKQNVTVDGGFRISPSCHFDLAVNNNGAPPPSFQVAGIGWDGAGCPPGNPEYLGPLGPPVFGAALYVDDNGLPFSLLSLQDVGVNDFLAQSSKGTIVSVPRPESLPGRPFEYNFDFIGPGWSDIQWVVFFPGGPGTPSVGFDQLVVLVPAPSTLGLLGLGVLILGWRSRTLKRSPKRPSACR